MSELTCPQCGQVSAITVIRRHSDEFCEHCDFPLFWAPSAQPVMAAGQASDTTLRRLPGAGGRMLVGTQVCPECGELNPIAATHCGRCKVDFNPPPPPEPEPEPEPLPPPPPEPVVDEQSDWWWWLIAALFVIVTVVVIVLAA